MIPAEDIDAWVAKAAPDTIIGKIRNERHPVDIEEFLVARISEDENVARGSDFVVGTPWRYDPEYSVVWDGTGTAAASNIRPHGNSRTGEHIARHDPNRILAEAAAKRAVISSRNRLAIKALASVYAQHPDYLAEWAK